MKEQDILSFVTTLQLLIMFEKKSRRETETNNICNKEKEIVSLCLAFLFGNKEEKLMFTTKFCRMSAYVIDHNSLWVNVGWIS